MTKLRFNLAASAVLFLLAALLTGGCGGGGTSTNDISAETLTGHTWQLTSIRSASGAETTCPGTLNGGSGSSTIDYSCDATDYLTFNANRTLVGSGSNVGFDGTWSLTDSTLTMTAVDTNPDSGATVTSRIVYDATLLSGGSNPSYRLTVRSLSVDGVTSGLFGGASVVITRRS